MADVELALEAAVGTRVLSQEEQLAADVTGNGTVTSADASLIWQFSLNLISRFPVAEACGSDWVLIPDATAIGGQQINDPVIAGGECALGTIVLDPLTGVVEDRNFRAILFGDIDGSWTPAGGGATP